MNNIKVTKEFLENQPKPEKLIRKTAEFLGGAKLEPIIVDDKFTLIDGYCSYLIAKELQNNKVKIIQIKEKRGQKNE